MPKPIDFRTRLISRIRIEPETLCWIWLGDTSTGGYGQVKPPGKKRTYAHRASYEVFVASIPDGMVIDHLCRVPACINPSHLEPVTSAENARRGLLSDLREWPTVCKYGHDLSPGNYYERKLSNGRTARPCKICASRHTANYKARKSN